jgi:hypothetical protein
MPEKQLNNTKGEMTAALCKRLKGPQEMAFPFENILSAFRRRKRLQSGTCNSPLTNGED